jgi:hypothetical protein
VPRHQEITVEQRYWWRIALERRLRQSGGDAFQRFFSEVMRLRHGEDFVQVRPFGKRGDKGCDGYLRSTGQLFQCFGALNGQTNQVAKLVRKINDDFIAAMTKVPDLLREWHFVHNLIDGMPIEAVVKLKEIERAHPALKFGFFGLESFAEAVFALGLDGLATLLGPAASREDVESIDVTVLRSLIRDLEMAAEAIDFRPLDLRPAPMDKLNYNHLPNHWKMLITGGWMNTSLLIERFAQPDPPLLGDRIAKLFSAKYEYFKAQGLAPGAIMAALFDFVTGIGHVPPQQQVAAQALLAYCFENCHIFEREPDGVAP